MSTIVFRMIMTEQVTAIVEMLIGNEISEYRYKNRTGRYMSRSVLFGKVHVFELLFIYKNFKRCIVDLEHRRNT